MKKTVEVTKVVREPEGSETKRRRQQQRPRSTTVTSPQPNGKPATKENGGADEYSMKNDHNVWSSTMTNRRIGK
jgi:hypothetical protein